jgi:uncharacterized membrane protein
MEDFSDPTRDSKNYKWGFFYCNRNDPRIFVPKRYGFGYGLNFHQPYVALGLILVILIILYMAFTH